MQGYQSEVKYVSLETYRDHLRPRDTPVKELELKDNPCVDQRGPEE